METLGTSGFSLAAQLFALGCNPLADNGRARFYFLHSELIQLRSEKAYWTLGERNDYLDKLRAILSVEVEDA